MTISTTVSQVTYSPTGAQTEFAVPFPFYDGADLQVVERVIATGAETVKTLDTHYTVSGGNGATGTVTAAAAPAATVQWVIRRTTRKTQEIDYVENDPFPAASHEEGLDRAVLRDQEMQEEIDRTLKFRVSDPDASMGEIPASVARASKLFGFDETGKPTVFDPEDASVVQSLATGSSVPRTLADRFAEARNAKDFGAVGDGVADDTAAIQAAIDVARVSQGGGRVVLPVGVYKTTAPLRLYPGVRVAGVNSGEAIIGTQVRAHHNGAVFDFDETFGAAYFHHGGVERMSIKAGIGFAPAAAIDIYQAGENCILSELSIEDCVNGVVLGRDDETTSQVSATLENISFQRNSGAAILVQMAPGAAAVVFARSISGDGNGHMLKAVGLGASSSIMINGIKTEAPNTGEHEPCILLDASSLNLTIFGGWITTGAATGTENVMQITTSGTPKIAVIGVGILNYVNLINDNVANETVTVASGIATVFYKHSGLLDVSRIRPESIAFDGTNPTIFGNDTDGALKIGTDASALLGGSITIYGDAHVTQARDLELRDRTSVFFHFDSSDDVIYLGQTASFVVLRATRLHRNVTDSSLTIGGSTINTGASLQLFGSSHAIQAGDFALRDGSADIILYDKSANLITFSDDEVRLSSLAGSGARLVMADADGDLSASMEVFGGSVVWDPVSLADGSGETSAAITVTGAALGDFVMVAAPYDLQGTTATAYVTAADTVKIRVQNETGGTIDLASGTWNVRVIKG